MKLDVLALAAHRDDLEITCGGTIIKLADLGYKVGVIDLTQGEMGTKGTKEEREQEAQYSAQIMGVAIRENLYLPDAGLENTRANKLKVAQVIRRFKPHLLILPYWRQRHPDHTVTPRIAYDACFLAGLKKLELEGEPHRPFKIIYSTSYFEIKHTFIVEVSEQFERKIQAVRCYRSQFDESPESKEIYPPARNIFEFMEVKARHYGYLIGKKYGEAFLTREYLEIEDPMKLQVRSI